MWCFVIFCGFYYIMVISVVYFEWCYGVIFKGIYVVIINLLCCDGYFCVVYWNIKYGICILYFGFDVCYCFIEGFCLYRCGVLFYLCMCVCVCVVFFVSFLFFLIIIFIEIIFIRYKWFNCNFVIYNLIYCK